MSLKTEVQITGDASSLERATKKASRDLDRFGKKTKSFGSKFKGFGLGAAAGFITGQLVSLSGDLVQYSRSSVEAAIADNTAQKILDTAIRRTTKATASQVTEVEANIAAWEKQFGILDDNLRPAYQKLITSTHSISKSNYLMQIAMDGSAATGKPLVLIAQALGKAFNGSKGALDKLIPGLKNAKDPIKQFAKATKGAAQTAKDNNPFASWDITSANLAESFGNKLLPKLQEFSTWLDSPQGTQAVEAWATALTSVATAMTSIVQFSGDFASRIPDMGGYFDGKLRTPSNPTSAFADFNALYPLAGGQPQPGQPYTGPNGKVIQNYTINVTNQGKEITPEAIATYIKKGWRLYGTGK